MHLPAPKQHADRPIRETEVPTSTFPAITHPGYPVHDHNPAPGLKEYYTGNSTTSNAIWSAIAFCCGKF